MGGGLNEKRDVVRTKAGKGTEGWKMSGWVESQTHSSGDGVDDAGKEEEERRREEPSQLSTRLERNDGDEKLTEQ